MSIVGTSQMALVVKNMPASAGDIRDMGLIPGSRRSPGRGHGNPLQYFYLEHPMDRAWQTTVHNRVEKSQTQLKRLSRTHMNVALLDRKTPNEWMQDCRFHSLPFLRTILLLYIRSVEFLTNSENSFT